MSGAVLSLREKDGDAGALEFASSVLIPTGTGTGLVWPDNLSFAPGGAMMITTDYKVAEPPAAGSSQEKWGNNQLFVALTDGPGRGQVRRFAVAPRGAEFCSPTLSPDGSELWVCVQHPGDGHASTWPNGAGAKPQSALVAIRRI
jgi:secreted PhoX family phosphatase